MSALTNPAATRPPRTWLILGERTGDNSQVLALGRALGWPTEVKQIRYDAAEKIEFKDRGASLIGVDATASDRLEAPWPEAIIAIGRRSVPVTRWIREQARAAGINPLHIHLGRPRTDLGLFDLVVTTPQYNLPPAPNVMEISLPIVFVDGEELGRAAARWHERFARMPRPWHAILIGGPSPQLAFGAEEAEQLLGELADWHRQQGGSLLVTTSPRTPPEVTARLRGGLNNPQHHLLMPFAAGSDNPYQALLALADDFVVTIDSASMVAEAATRRKPIYLFDLPKIPPKQKPGLKAALSRNWRLRRKSRLDAGLPPDFRDQIYDAWTRRGKARPRRDIGQLLKRLISTGIAQPLKAPSPSPSEISSLPTPAQELAAVLERVQSLWKTRLDKRD
ncbi:mitochondrial fission ELM1 family protein [Dongia sp.]|uniref:mitochondrial fission ELM1 family protein n=1 Tax=Dongia sp. TaxID=1977262 RepID=UPI0035AE2B51